MVHNTAVSRGTHSGETKHPLQQKQRSLDGEFKCEVALLLTELEMRALSPCEVQELRTAGKRLKTLTLSPQTKEISETELSERPVLVLFTEERTVKEAFKLLCSLLERSKPVPKPRMKFSQHAGQKNSLIEALRRGMETGASMLMFQHTSEIKTQRPTPEPTGSADVWRKTTHDVRLSTYRRMDSLEETIRELENTLIEISGYPDKDQFYVEATMKTAPEQRTVPEIKKPPVPPKPSSFSPASIQVQFLLVLCRSALKDPALFSFFTSSLLMTLGTLPLSL